MFPRADSWIALKQRLDAMKLRGIEEGPAPATNVVDHPDNVCFRIDMRDGHCCVSQPSRPDARDLTHYLTAFPLRVTPDAMSKLVSLEQLATELVRGVEDPWMWFNHPENKYINVYIDPVSGGISMIRNNFGAFTTLDAIRKRE